MVFIVYQRWIHLPAGIKSMNGSATTCIANCGFARHIDLRGTHPLTIVTVHHHLPLVERKVWVARPTAHMVHRCTFDITGRLGTLGNTSQSACDSYGRKKLFH